MKKILSVLLVAILAIGCFALVGCGDNTFGGNYEEATATDVQNFANEVAQAEGVTEIDIADGYALYIDVYAPSGAMTVDATLDMQIKAVDGAIQMQGKMDANMSSSSITQKSKGTCYWVDGVVYENVNVTATMGGQTQSGSMKMKYAMPEFEDFVGEYASIAEGLDFAGLVEMSISNEAIGLSMVRDDNGTKIKFVIPENEAMAGEVVFVFDASYNLTSMKIDIEAGETSMLMTYKPWNGNINLPGDLNSYQNMAY